MDFWKRICISFLFSCDKLSFPPFLIIGFLLFTTLMALWTKARISSLCSCDKLSFPPFSIFSFLLYYYKVCCLLAGSWTCGRVLVFLTYFCVINCGFHLFYLQLPPIAPSGFFCFSNNQGASYSYSCRFRHFSYNNSMKKIIYSYDMFSPIGVLRRVFLEASFSLVYTLKNLFISYHFFWPYFFSIYQLLFIIVKSQMLQACHCIWFFIWPWNKHGRWGKISKIIWNGNLNGEKRGVDQNSLDRWDSKYNGTKMIDRKPGVIDD